jgi:hypothetical protein
MFLEHTAICACAQSPVTKEEREARTNIPILHLCSLFNNNQFESSLASSQLIMTRESPIRTVLVKSSVLLQTKQNSLLTVYNVRPAWVLRVMITQIIKNSDLNVLSDCRTRLDSLSPSMYG